MSDRLCIDLCSGLGGFSQAFVDAGWEVVRIDNDPKFKVVPHTIVRDVRELHLSGLPITISSKLKDYESIIVLFSPMCNHFSTAGLVNGWPRKGIRDAFDLIGAGLEFIAEVREEAGEKHAWVMENPVSVIKYFMPKPMARIRLSDYGSPNKKPTYLWGNVRLPLVIAIGDWLKVPRENYFNRQRERRGIMRMKSSAERADMSVLSAPILDAILPSETEEGSQ